MNPSGENFHDPGSESSGDETLLPPLSSLGPSHATDIGDDETFEGSRLVVDQLGPYQIVRKIGEGGMGSVYEAEQLEPVKRKVALKVIKAGRDNKNVVARLEAERQALAMMDHPSIARIIDAGTTESGQPYFAMEFVDGGPLTQYCDENALSIEDRLKLFCQICDGIQHAHQKGIIHRDLKPGNILVAEYDGKPAPKIIDFGLAKALETTPKLTDKSIHTEFGQVLGTLKYMSPEQAGLDALDIDTRTDIYSLGIILYELLTGSTPLDSSSIKENALLKVLELVREQEAPRPSSKLSTDAHRISTISSRRKIEPRKLTSILAGELDWVVMKALEKERDRRYATAGDFAKDVLRYLSGEPIVARPPSQLYQLQKFVRRHRVPVLASVALLLSLVVGIIGTGWNLSRALIAEADALGKQQIAEQQKSRAELREKNAVDAISRFSEVIADNPQLKYDSTLSKLREKLLNEPIAILTSLRLELEKDSESDPGSLVRLAEIAGDLGKLSFSIGDREDALNARTQEKNVWERLIQSKAKPEFSENLALCYYSLGSVQLEFGEHAVAKSMYEQARTIQLSLIENYPAERRYQEQLAVTVAEIAGILDTIGQSGQSQVLLAESLTTLNRLREQDDSELTVQIGIANRSLQMGLLKAKLGNVDEGIQFVETAISVWQKLSNAHSDEIEFRVQLARAHNDVGTLYSTQSDFENEEKEYRLGLETLQEIAGQYSSLTDLQTSIANSYNNLAQVQMKLEDPKKGLEFFRKAFAIRQRLADQNPRVAEFVESLATSHSNLAAAYKKVGDHDAAMKEQEIGLAIQRQLAEDYPEIVEFQDGLAREHHLYARYLADVGYEESAFSNLKKTIAIREKLASEHPAVIELQIQYASAWHDMGVMLNQAMDFQKAIEAYQRSLEIYENTYKNDDLKLIDHFAVTENSIAIAQWHLGKKQLAVEHGIRAVGKDLELVQAFPKQPGRRAQLANSYQTLAFLQTDISEFAEAKESYQEALKIRRRLTKEYPDSLEHFLGLAETQFNLGHLAGRVGDQEQSLIEYRNALQTHRYLVDHFPPDLQLQAELSKSLFNVAKIEQQLGLFEESLTHLMKAMSAVKTIADSYPSQANTLALAQTASKIAAVQVDLQRYRAAADSVKEAIGIYEKYLNAEPENVLALDAIVSDLRSQLQVASKLQDRDLIRKSRTEIVKWLGEDARLAKLRGRLVEAEDGALPEGVADRLGLAKVAYRFQRFELAAQLFENVLATGNEDGGEEVNIYQAACSAVLAGTGMGQRELSQEASAKWRALGLAWLNEELKRIRAAWGSDASKIAKPIPLEFWSADPDLATVRGEAIEVLPQAEQKPWREFWAEIDEIKLATEKKD